MCQETLCRQAPIGGKWQIFVKECRKEKYVQSLHQLCDSASDVTTFPTRIIVVLVFPTKNFLFQLNVHKVFSHAQNYVSAECSQVPDSCRSGCLPGSALSHTLNMLLGKNDHEGTRLPIRRKAVGLPLVPHKTVNLGKTMRLELTLFSVALPSVVDGLSHEGVRHNGAIGSVLSDRVGACWWH